MNCESISKIRRLSLPFFHDARAQEDTGILRMHVYACIQVTKFLQDYSARIELVTTSSSPLKEDQFDPALDVG
jgi:hypothetical protein